MKQKGDRANMGNVKQLPDDHQLQSGEKSILIRLADDGGVKVTLAPASAWKDVREVMMALGMAGSVVLRVLEQQQQEGMVGG